MEEMLDLPRLFLRGTIRKQWNQPPSSVAEGFTWIRRTYVIQIRLWVAEAKFVVPPIIQKIL